MSKRQFIHFQKNLLKFGIIPFLSFSSLYTHADTPLEQSLIILENRENKAVDTNTSLQHKILALKSLAAEQSTKIQTLNKEINNLKNKLHLAQINKHGNTDKNLYISLKQESAQRKELQIQLEENIKELEKIKDSDAKHKLELNAHIDKLVAELESKNDYIKLLEDNIAKEKEKFNQSINENDHFKNLSLKLEQEVDQYKQTISKLENSIKDLRDENSLEKEKASSFMVVIEQLKTALDDQKTSIESLSYQNEQLLFSINESSEQKASYEKELVELNEELDQNKIMQAQLNVLVQDLKNENEENSNKLKISSQKIEHLLLALDEKETILNNLKENELKASEQISISSQEISRLKELNNSLNQEIESLSRNKDELEVLVLLLREEKDTEKIKLASAEDTLRELQNRLTSLDDQFQLAAAEKDRYFQTIEEKEVLIYSSEKKLLDYQNEIENLKNSIASLEKDLSFQKNLLVLKNHEIELTHEKAQTKRQKELTLNLFEALENEQSLYLLSHDSLTKENNQKLDQLRGELEQAIDKQQTLHELIAHLKNENELERQKNDESASTIARLSNTIDAFSVEMENKFIEQQQENIAHLENAKIELSKHLETIASHESDIENYKSQFDKIQMKLDKQKQQTSKAKEEQISLLKDMYELFELESLKLMLGYQEKISAYHSNLDQSKQTVLSLEETSSMLQDTIDALHKENLKIAFLQNELDDLQQMHDQSEKNYTEIHKEHHVALTNFENLKNDHEKLQISYEESINQQENLKQIVTSQLDKLAQTESDLNSHKNAYEEVKQELSLAYEKLHVSEDLLNKNDLQYQEKIHQLQQLLDEESYKNQQLKSEFESHLSMLDEKQKKIDELQYRLDYPSRNEFNEISEADKYQLIKAKIEAKNLLELNNLK